MSDHSEMSSINEEWGRMRDSSKEAKEEIERLREEIKKMKMNIDKKDEENRKIREEKDAEIVMLRSKNKMSSVKLNENTVENTPMDQLLPKEILAQIASFLPRRDFNCLSRTSKTALWKLKPYSEPLRIDLEIISDEMDSGVGDGWGLRFEVHLKNEKGLRCFKSALCNGTNSLTDADHIYTKDEKKGEVRGFYYRNRENPSNWHNAETCFVFGISEGLSHHLSFLLSHKVFIDKLYCDNLEEAELSELAEQIGGHQTRVNELILIEECKLDIIIAIDPECLTFDHWQIPDDFFQSNVVRKLAKLKLWSAVATMQEGDLPSLTAASIEMEKVKGVTVKDIKCFLKQWLESRRHFQFLKISMCVNVPIATWTTMLYELNINLEEFDGIISGVCARFTRRDGHKVDFLVQDNEKIVFLFTPSLN